MYVAGQKHRENGDVHVDLEESKCAVVTKRVRPAGERKAYIELD